MTGARPGSAEARFFHLAVGRGIAGGCREPCCSAAGARDLVLQAAAMNATRLRRSGEAARLLVLLNGALGNKQFGICPHVRDLFSLRGWMHFWAGGQQINTVFRERKGMWMVL